MTQWTTHPLHDAVDEIAVQHKQLVGDQPKPGHDANEERVADHVERLHHIIENSVQLKAEYDKGATHDDRRDASTGHSTEKSSSARIAELERELAEARKNNG